MIPTFVYLIEAENGRVKIGSGQYPTDRASACRLHSPVPTRLIAAWPGTVTDEFALHRRFETFRSHGEWFYLRNELAEFVETKRGTGMNRVDTWAEAHHDAALNSTSRDLRRSRSEARKLIAQPERNKHQPGHAVGLTDGQKSCLTFIRQYIADQGVSPSFDEIRVGLSLASKSGVHRHVHALVERGHLRLLSDRRRSISLVEAATAPPSPATVAEAA